MLFVIAGPSGVGKSYLIADLLATHPDLFMSPQLITTRPPRTAQGGGQEVDRLSVSHDDFQAMHRAGDFVVADKFHTNWYGFPAAITQPQPQHVIINIWPALLPQFAKLSGVQLLGLSVSPENRVLLRQRMFERGDSEQIVAERMKQVEIDLADLTTHADLVAQHGRMFEITGDDTIPAEVIPYILELVASHKRLG